MEQKTNKILPKLLAIIGEKKSSPYEIQNIEIQNAKIKNLTHAIAHYGAKKENFIGMITITYGKNRNHRILPNDDVDTIIEKTKIMYNSIIYFLNRLKKKLSRHGHQFIYLCVFELQQDGNLHAHIYFSAPLKSFGVLFTFYHEYTKEDLNKSVKSNRKTKKIIPVGRMQLGIASEFLPKLIEYGYHFKMHIDKQRKNRFVFRCTNFVSYDEFCSGSWPTLFFYRQQELQQHYSERILKYLTKSIPKSTKQKVVGDHFVIHNTKNIFANHDQWAEVQKAFIRKVCGRVYTSSRIPIPITQYQKNRNEIIRAYEPYKNLNCLVLDVVERRATLKGDTLVCPNGKEVMLR